MKKLYTLLSIITIMLLSSCSGHRYPQQLVLGDSLSDKDPKKAITLLDSIKPQIKDAGKAVKNYYALLRIKTGDKTNVKHTSDTTILRLVDYYENGGDRHLLPTAYYYAGRVYRDLQDAPKALDYFQKAEEAVKRITPGDKRLLGFIYGQTGTVLDQQGFHNEALEAFMDEREMKTSLKDTVGLVYSLRDIGGTYWDLEKLDSAMLYYKEADRLALTINDKYASADINTQMAALYNHIGKPEMAWKCLKHAASYNSHVNESSTLSIYSDYFESTGQEDSALACYKKLLTVGNIYGRQGAYKGLAEYYLNRGENNNARKYLNLYMQITDSIKKINVADAVAGSLATYRYNLQERKEYELTINMQKEQEQKILLFFMLILTIIISSSVILWYKHKNKLMKLEKERAELAEKNRILEEQKLRENKILQVKSSGIYRIITKKLSDYNKTNETLTEEEWSKLNETINNIYMDFDMKIHNLIPGISIQEYRVCMLIKAGIRPTGIGVLTNRSRAAINSTRIRLFEKAYAKKGSPSDWDNIVNSL